MIPTAKPKRARKPRAPGAAPRAKPRAIEEAEQKALIRWVDTLIPQIRQLENLTAMPNGGKRPQKVNEATGKRYSVEAAKLKAMGARPGYPDLLLDFPAGQYHGLRIEMKAAGGSTNDGQKDWIARLRVAGYRCEVCYTWAYAAMVITEYLLPVLTPRQVMVMRNSLPHAPLPS